MSGKPLVGVVMGSDSDWPVMEAAALTLAEFDIGYEADVVSAHRMPHEMITYGTAAESRGLRVIIAGAGGAAHLPGMLAAVTPLPVGGARNAGLLAVRILGVCDSALRERMTGFQERLRDEAIVKGTALRASRADG